MSQAPLFWFFKCKTELLHKNFCIKGFYFWGQHFSLYIAEWTVCMFWIQINVGKHFISFYFFLVVWHLEQWLLKLEIYHLFLLLWNIQIIWILPSATFRNKCHCYLSFSVIILSLSKSNKIFVKTFSDKLQQKWNPCSLLCGLPSTMCTETSIINLLVTDFFFFFKF